jgi:ADP-heptose:LPS heptosyltransferase
MKPQPVKPKLLVIELWGLGDLVLATPFLRAATQKYDITLMAKSYASELQTELWPEIEVLPFVAPWTAFRKKYHLNIWPWREMFRVIRETRTKQFDAGLSARWDPRDHLLLFLAGAKQRFGFARLGSSAFLTQSLRRPDAEAHRYEYWRSIARAVDVEMPSKEDVVIPFRSGSNAGEILIHTGAAQPVRVWPLENYRKLVARLRQKNYRVQVACDTNQRDWWLQNGESNVSSPRTVAELVPLLHKSAAFVGNDSGPGHLAALLGVRTFTIFGPQLPEWFAPLHPAAKWVEGKACPYKPCFDYCRFNAPVCMTRWSEAEIWAEVEPFVEQITKER